MGTQRGPGTDVDGGRHGGDTFPRQSARTQRFSLGEPRNITVSPDGKRIVFLRSRGGSDPLNCLWSVDATEGGETLVADPSKLTDSDELTTEERDRRERLREAASGITAYAVDREAKLAAFAIAGQLYVADVLAGGARPIDVDGPVFDPRPDPRGRRVAYVSDRRLCTTDLGGACDVVAGADLDEPDTISWGVADFVAAEEMHRFRGYWWSPDGEALAVCRVDVSDVAAWTIANPSSPSSPPATIRYPAAGTANPDVRLFVCKADGGEPVEVRWRRDAFPYVTHVLWKDRGLYVAVQSRDQTALSVLRVDAAAGTTSELYTDRDNVWVELVPGSPQIAPDGRLVMCADRDGARRLLIDGEPVTPPDQQVRAIVTVDDTGVVYLANPTDDATVQHVWRIAGDGPPEPLTDTPGVHTAAVGGETTVIRRLALDRPGATTETLDGVTIASNADVPSISPSVRLITTGDRQLATAVVLPNDRSRFAGRALPVLLDPYGGPHSQRVLAAHNLYLTPQWFADHGFVVVVVDGRGTPGRGTAWERAISGDLATAPLDDQADGLRGAAAWLAEQPEEWTAGITCDLAKVGIRGWSFGGYLSALAVLRRPDVFHAAVAGAPVTEWRLYDTHYTERYLGDPEANADAYDGSSLLPLAPNLERPLLLIHGLADDNVVAAHTLQLSSALLAAGRPHEVLPLVGVTHLASQEVVAENLLLHQLAFLRRSLGVADTTTS